MSLVLAALTGVVVVGAVVAVTARHTRTGLLGLLVALLAAPLVADPLPGPLSIAARIVGAVLACQLVAIAIRAEAEPTGGSRLGWPVEALAAAAAVVLGFGTHGLGAAGAGPAQAQAAGFAVGVLAATPLVTGRDVFRLGVGAMLLVTAALLVRQGIGGTPSELEQLATSGLVAGLGAAVAAIVLASRQAGEGLTVRDEGARRAARAAIGRPDSRSRLGPAAHPLEPREAGRSSGRFPRRPSP